MPATIEIDVRGRWDAVALTQRLGSYRPYLVQFAPTRWLVHAEAPGCHGEPLPGALAAIEASLASRHIEGARVRIGGRLLPSTRGRPAAGQAAKAQTAAPSSEQDRDGVELDSWGPRHCAALDRVQLPCQSFPSQRACLLRRNDGA